MARYLAFVLALFAALAAQADNVTSLGRMKLDHPNLGHTGGAALHSHIADIYTKLSNNVDTRYQEYTSVANSAVTTYEHNFNVPFADMAIVLWSGIGSAKTRIENPTASGWTIAATSGFTKTKIDITAPSSGGPHDFSVEVHSGLRALSTASTSNVTFSGSTITGLSTLLLTSSTVYDWLRFQESGGSDYVQIAAPSLASSYTLTLPTNDGNADEVMITDGSGALSFGKVANANVSSSAAIDYSKLNLSNSIVNNDVNSSAAIAYSKLNLSSSIVNADVNASAAIAYSKLNLLSSIVNADVSNSAAIAYGKLNLSNSIVNADVNASAGIDATKIGAGSVSNTELGYVDGVTSSIQTQLDAKLSKSGGVMTGAITLSGDAVNPLEPVSKQQFDAGLNGIAWKQPVRTATTVPGTLATSFENGDSVGGVTVATGERILIKNQATDSENGIYLVNASGAPSRSADADAYTELNGAAVIVSEGTNANRGFYQSGELTSFAGQTWFQNFGTGLYLADGNGIELSGSTFSLELDGTSLSKSASGLKVEEGNLTLDNIGGTLSVSKGGTGSGTASGARSNLSAAQSGANSDITSLSGLTTPLSVGQGGTGSATAGGARSNLSAAASGANSDITSLSGLTTPLSVSQGGTGLASGTSGGVPYYSGSTTIASSAALTQNGVVLGGGTGAAPTATTAGSAYQPLRVPSGGGAPAFGALDVSQSAAVTGQLAVANGGTGSSTASGARSNLSAAESGVNSDITALNSGNIGIGTTVPANKLTVNGAANFVGNIGIGTASPTHQLGILSANDTDTGIQIRNTHASFAAALVTEYKTPAKTYQFAVGGQNRTDALQNAWYLWDETAVNSRILVSSAGNVGIGVGYLAGSDPQALLSVASGSKFRVNSSGDVSRIKDVAYVWPSSQGSASTVLTNDGSGNLSWSAGGSGPWATSGNDIYNTNTGNIGIGTSMPTTMVDLIIDNGVNDGLRFGSNDSNQFAYINAHNNLNHYSFLTVTGSAMSTAFTDGNEAVLYSEAPNGFRIQTESSGLPIRFFPGGTESMRLTTGGNVGIGTTTPAQKLAVNGNAEVLGVSLIGSSQVGLYTVAAAAGTTACNTLCQTEPSPIISTSGSCLNAWETTGNTPLSATSTVTGCSDTSNVPRRCLCSGIK
jgi:hypothetical protein